MGLERKGKEGSEMERKGKVTTLNVVEIK